MFVAYWRTFVLAFTVSQAVASVDSAPGTSDDGQLSVYGPVPGLPQSPFYTLQVSCQRTFALQSFHSFKELRIFANQNRCLLRSSQTRVLNSHLLMMFKHLFNFNIVV